jgi:hypothetical protein
VLKCGGLGSTLRQRFSCEEGFWGCCTRRNVGCRAGYRGAFGDFSFCGKVALVVVRIRGAKLCFNVL